VEYCNGEFLFLEYLLLLKADSRFTGNFRHTNRQSNRRQRRSMALQLHQLETHW
jgi:hypothetical protein